MSNKVKNYKEECLKIIAEYGKYILLDAEYRMQEVPEGKPTNYIVDDDTEKALFMHWKPPALTAEKSYKFDGHDPKLLERLSDLAKKDGVVGNTKNEDNVYFRFIKCRLHLSYLHSNRRGRRRLTKCSKCIAWWRR